jgi:thiosulfate oxidation carrier complex protein SoxZ
VQESTRVLALALLADGRALEARRELRVTAGGCVGGGDPEAVSSPAASPTKLRTQLLPDRGVMVRALLTHEMESGQRSDPQGRPIPAWHITEVNLRLNGQVVLSAWWGPSIARNPFLQFTLRQARAGDRVALGWVDNRGNRRNDEAVVGG